MRKKKQILTYSLGNHFYVNDNGVYGKSRFSIMYAHFGDPWKKTIVMML
jgi:hypothetical protein